jgi:hypothetical protein
MITRVSSAIPPKASDLIFDHPYNADYGVVVACVSCPGELWQNSQFWRLAGQVS